MSANEIHPAHEVHPGVKISCSCSDEVKNVSPADAVRAALSGCKDCGENHLISVNFQKGGKK